MSIKIHVYKIQSVFILRNSEISYSQVEFWKNCKNYKELFELIEKAYANLDGVAGFYAETEYLFVVGVIFHRAKHYIRGEASNTLSSHLEIYKILELSIEGQKIWNDRLNNSMNILEYRASKCPSNNSHKLSILKAEQAMAAGRSLILIIPIGTINSSTYRRQTKSDIIF